MIETGESLLNDTTTPFELTRSSNRLNPQLGLMKGLENAFKVLLFNTFSVIRHNKANHWLIGSTCRTNVQVYDPFVVRELDSVREQV